MTSTMLPATSAGSPGRISQLLPTVKCSTCHQPVPLSDLGEHTCIAPPPIPTLPKPSVIDANALLPSRLQGRVASPALAARGSPSNASTSINSRLPSSPPRSQQLPPHQRVGKAAPDALKLNTTATGSSASGFQPRPSPLARSGPGNNDAASPVMNRPRDPFQRPPASADFRTRNTPNNSSMSSNYPYPVPPRSAAANDRGMSPPQDRPPPLDQGRFPPSRTGAPVAYNGPPPQINGLSSGPKGSFAIPRAGFNGLPPPTSGPSPTPSVMRSTPSPSPSMMNRQGPPPPGAPSNRMDTPLGPPPNRTGTPLGPPNRIGIPLGPAPMRGVPPSRGPPNIQGSPPNRNGVPFVSGGPPPGPSGMSPGPNGARPPFNAPPRPYATSLPSNTHPPAQMAPPQSPMMPYGQRIPENDIDTKSGGEAGMAGVGRRGFAAVARAAMFAAPPLKPTGPQPQPANNRRPDAPRYLDIDAASRSTDTPPLSAGSGYSSHSPGPTSPLSQSHFPPPSVEEPKSENMPRMPTPPTRIDTSAFATPPNIAEKTPMQASNTPISPFGIRLPFFEKLKGLVPGSSSPVETTPTTPIPPAYNSLKAASRETPTPTPPSPVAPPLQLSGRSTSVSSSRKGSRRDVDVRPPMSPSSDSEYGGLAYADSTDYEDDSKSTRSDVSRKRSEVVPPLPPHPILRSGSASRSGHVQFSTPSGRHHIDPRGDREGITIGEPKGHRRDASASSYSSTSSAGGGDEIVGRKRTNSAAIALALGLSQTPPSEYAKLGGPGVKSHGGRLGRSASGSSTGSKSSYSRITSGGPSNGATNGIGLLERTMGALLRNEEKDRKVELIKSKSTGSATGKQRSGGGSSFSGSAGGTDHNLSDKDRGSVAASSTGSRAQRSNTVQVISSPESRPPKLPTRAKTAVDKSGGIDGNRTKVKVKKQKNCVRCSKLIDDGRWVQVDSGGVLCERCWKNMYLPKCRRCNLPIEKQAVSSSDGQLKGKYHKECFNCHTCHKPFPDKTFYVYDGKPLCAYHYHEANDSLCAAARCGQPIEGPCAVSHSGDRYHPEHMTCEYPGHPECMERLTEYWEVDGRMLCERHGNMNSPDDDNEWVPSSRAMKRVTRFIDLTGGVGAGNNGGGGVDGSELR